MHQGLRSIVRLMETGDAFCKTPSTVCPRNLTETLKKFDCSLIAYGSGVLVIGSKDRRVMAFDAETKRMRWDKSGNVVCCVVVSNDLIIAGTHWGQLRIISLNGSFQYEKLFGCNSVTALDIHESGRFVLAGFCDGTVRLIGNELDHTIVKLGLPKRADVADESRFQEVSVKKVFFLPESNLPPNHLAICVCAKQSVTMAVIDHSGKVKEQHCQVSFNKMLSFCCCKSDPGILYASMRLSQMTVGIVKYEMRPTSSSPSYTLERSDLMVESVESAAYVYCRTFSMLILAAGKRFLIAAVIRDLVIFDLVLRKRVAEVVDFFANLDVTRITIDHSPERMTAVDVDWLDGLSPANTQPHNPIILFGVTARWGGFTLFSLNWSPGLWKHWALCQTPDTNVGCLLIGCHCQAVHYCGAAANFCGRSTNSMCSGDTDLFSTSPMCHAHQRCNGCGVELEKLFGGDTLQPFANLVEDKTKKSVCGSCEDAQQPGDSFAGGSDIDRVTGDFSDETRCHGSSSMEVGEDRLSSTNTKGQRSEDDGWPSINAEFQHNNPTGQGCAQKAEEGAGQFPDSHAKLHRHEISDRAWPSKQPADAEKNVWQDLKKTFAQVLNNSQNTAEDTGPSGSNESEDTVSGATSALGIWRNAELFKKKADHIVKGKEDYDFLSRDGVVVLDFGS
ncbi:hypothetical protein V1264_002065 [Littorina saxatilis]|uniref:Uncharacterized protein n=2 Tax=Littorina saxatilis TaxID=31220 RepID=A0AAN9GRP3_9CAEN